jgi:hypothetical protein
VGHAAATRAPDEAKRLVSPRIRRRGAALRDDLDVGRLVTRPARAVAAAYRAIAIGQRSGTPGNFDPDRAAMASSRRHGTLADAFSTLSVHCGPCLANKDL